MTLNLIDTEMTLTFERSGELTKLSMTLTLRVRLVAMVTSLHL